MKYGLGFIICGLFSNILLANADHHGANEGIRCEGKAYYTLTFQAEWSNETHPSPVFPETAMFSPLIGATHSAAYEMWRRGKSASPGVQRVAETGKMTILQLCSYALNNRSKTALLYLRLGD